MSDRRQMLDEQHREILEAARRVVLASVGRCDSKDLATLLWAAGITKDELQETIDVEK